MKEGRNHDAEEMSCTAHVQRRHEENGCLMICDEKLAKKAWIALVQRVDLAPVDYTFDIEVQAMSGEKLPFIVRAVVFTVAPRTTAAADDDDKGLRYDDNLSQHFNDVVRGVIERKTRALVASMTMEEIFRATTSSSINHQAVFEFENVQLELKHFDRLIVYDACVYVKPQSVDVSGNEDFSYVVAAEDDEEGHTGKVLLTVVLLYEHFFLFLRGVI